MKKTTVTDEHICPTCCRRVCGLKLEDRNPETCVYREPPDQAKMGELLPCPIQHLIAPILEASCNECPNRRANTKIAELEAQLSAAQKKIKNLDSQIEVLCLAMGRSPCPSSECGDPVVKKCPHTSCVKCRRVWAENVAKENANKEVKL